MNTSDTFKKRVMGLVGATPGGIGAQTLDELITHDSFNQALVSIEANITGVLGGGAGDTNNTIYTAAMRNGAASSATAIKPPPPTKLSLAYDPPLQVIRDLWTARFGDTWVSKETLVDEPDSYLQHAAQRLLRANQMEHVHEYFRLIEKGLCK